MQEQLEHRLSNASSKQLDAKAPSQEHLTQLLIVPVLQLRHCGFCVASDGIANGISRLSLIQYLRAANELAQ